MSTQTMEQTNTQTGSTTTINRFVEAAVDRMPDLACIGNVSEVGEAKVTESGAYIRIPITIQPLEAGRPGYEGFLYHSDFLTPGFDPGTLDKGPQFVYKKNVAQKDGLSVLKGLAGSNEAFDALAEDLLNLGPEVGNKDAVRDVINNHITRGQNVGYVLTQKKEKTGEVDPETGKNVYEYRKQYEIGSYFFPTPVTAERLKKRAERSNGKFILTFEI